MVGTNPESSIGRTLVLIEIERVKTSPEPWKDSPKANRLLALSLRYIYFWRYKQLANESTFGRVNSADSRMRPHLGPPPCPVSFTGGAGPYGGTYPRGGLFIGPREDADA